MTTIVSAANKKALAAGNLLVGFLLAGYPDRETLLQIIPRCAEEGLDIFEVGFPSKNPYIDGQVIKAAHRRADLAVCTDLRYWHQIRKATDKPVWLMGYKEDLIDTGIYLGLAKERLIDGMVLPDCSFEKRKALAKSMLEYEIDVLGFVNPSMEHAELEKNYCNFSLVYTQLHNGPTGLTLQSDDYLEFIARIEQQNLKKSFGGFGISSPEMVKKLLMQGFAGVIVGTSMIRKLNRSPEELYTFIRRLKKSTFEAGEKQ